MNKGEIMKKYSLVASGPERLTASSKAKEDINIILENNGFNPISFNSKMNKLEKLFFSKKRIDEALCEVNDGVFIIQYPIYSYYLLEKILNKLKLKQVKIIGIVHDIASLRNSDVDADSKPKELSVLKKFDVLIVHNNKMAEWLESEGVLTPKVNLEIFDYLNESMISSPQLSEKMIFAGNLKKADFLDSLSPQVQMNIYGPNQKNSYPKGIKYKGAYKPDELSKHLEGSFGVVWDGNSGETCTGAYGNYLRFNNPHKISLYLSSGYPIIIWNQAAMADFIVKNNLGLAIGNLNEVNYAIQKISKCEYYEMTRKVNKVAEELKKGHYTSVAIETAINIL